jgi:membrane-bound serine protease (ClpP class)
MIGLTGECIKELNPEGLIRVQGEIWKAVCKCGVVIEGREVVIEEFRGLTLSVKPKNEFE